MQRKVKAGDDTLNIRGDGRLDLVTKPFSILKRSDGTSEVKITAKSVDEVNKFIPHIAAALKMPEDRLREQLVQAVATKNVRRPGVIQSSLSFGGQDAIRSAAKACLVLWATLVGNNEIKGAAYDNVRRYIYEGDDFFNSTRTDLDSRYFDNIEMIQEKYGPFFNFIYVRSSAEGRVIGHFTLYNILAFHIVLVENGALPDRKIALISNPLDPVVWSDKAADEFDVSFAWLDAPEYYADNMKRYQERCSAIMQYYFDWNRRPTKEIARICDDVFKNHGFQEGQDIPAEQFTPMIIGEIASRLTKHVFGLSHEEKFTPAQMQELFGGNSPTDQS